MYLVAVNQSDKEKQRTERDGPGQDSFDQQHCPAAHEEDMDKQPEDRQKHNASYNVKEQNRVMCFVINDFRYI